MKGVVYINGVEIPDFPKKLKPAVSPRYVLPGWYAKDGITSTVGVGRIYYTPIFVAETTTFIGIGIRVDTALEGSADLRIFAWENGLPGKLILSAGTVDTGTIDAKEITISQTLSRGYYFLAVRCTSACQLRGIYPFSAATSPVPGLRSTTYPNPAYCILAVTAEYADPAPTPDGIADAAWACVFLRES